MRPSLAACLAVVTLAFLVALVPFEADAQDRLKSMPGYDQYIKMSAQIPGAVKLGSLFVTWKDEGKSFDYRVGGKLMHFDIATKKAEEVGAAKGIDVPFKAPGKKGGGPPGGGFVQRGRQATTALAPGGKLKAFYRDHNLWISDAGGANEFAVTTDGNAKDRVKFGTACWVYGEELYQNTAMWWSPDAKKLAYYRVDESKVRDYYLQLDQTKLQSRMDIEAYPKAGATNPVLDLFVYDLATKKIVQLDVRDGKPFENDVVGHYVYGISWTADGKEVLFHRTNRKQNIMEFAAGNPETGSCRVVVREEWPASWTENSPTMRYLSDKNRFLWISERTGYKNIYLYDVSGKLLATVTKHPFEVAAIISVDEKAGEIFYTARSGDNPMKLQLHRCQLDGKNDKRLTDPAFHHSVQLAPDGKHFIDNYETLDTPPASRVVDADGMLVAELAKSDLTRFDALGLKKAERITFKAADGKTDLYGMLYRPSNFDPAKKYPLLVSVYAGPATNGASETFAQPSTLAEFGFLVARFDSRSAAGRGKVALDAIYGKLGVVEIDDQAAGVKALWDRPYLDKERVGIYGTSYGGYASTLCLLRHPDVFHAAVASSSVTDFRLYDSIYTERYMDLPQANKKGYDAGSAMAYASKLKGRLMIYFGTADDNVHPANSMQLIKALQAAGKSFEVQVGPDQGHTAISQPRMMEFFIENLVRK